MSFKMKILSMLAGVCLLAINVSTVVAAPILPIHIEVTENLQAPWNNPEDFFASGQAVDNGLVCAEGTVVDQPITKVVSAGPYQILWVHKVFTCDGSGDKFYVDMVVKLDQLTSNTTARWWIVGGTGQYAGLKGQGALIGTSYQLGEIDDVYDGKVH